MSVYANGHISPVETFMNALNAGMIIQNPVLLSEVSEAVKASDPDMSKALKFLKIFPGMVPADSVRARWDQTCKDLIHAHNESDGDGDGEHPYESARG